MNAARRRRFYRPLTAYCRALSLGKEVPMTPLTGLVTTLAAGAAATLPAHIPARPLTPLAHPARRRPPVRPSWGQGFPPGSPGEKP
jgi:hypothetical protein